MDRQRAGAADQDCVPMPADPIGKTTGARAFHPQLFGRAVPYDMARRGQHRCRTNTTIQSRDWPSTPRWT